MRDFKQWIEENPVVAVATEDMGTAVYLRLAQIEDGKISGEEFVIQIYAVENKDKKNKDLIN